MFIEMTPADYLRASMDNLQELLAKADDKRRAMNAALSLYHLHEWVWGQGLKARKPIVIRDAAIRDYNDFVSWLRSNCPHFDLLGELANGTKHCFATVPTKTVRRTELAGLACAPISVASIAGSWTLPPFLQVDLGEGHTDKSRFVPLKHLLAVIVDFWERLLAELELLPPSWTEPRHALSNFPKFA